MKPQEWLAEHNYYRWTLGYIAVVATLILVMHLAGL